MGTVLHESNFYVVERIDREVLRVTRKDFPFMTVDDVERACRPVQLALDLAGRSRHALLIDTRDVTGRNDPASEQMFAEHRNAIILGFRAVALLVKTPIGRLHIQRLLAEAKSAARVYMSEVEALAFLRSTSARSTSTVQAHKSVPPPKDAPKRGNSKQG